MALTNGAAATKFVVNPNAKLSQVLMRIKGGVTNYYIYGAGLLYEVTETATITNTLTYHFDYRGSTIALTGNNGNVTDRIEYSAYGLTTYRVGTSDTPFLFNGRYGVQTDANGLLYMRARYYNPYLCRFINQDPSGFSGGLNFYAYANGNPVSLLDPFGLGAVGEGGIMSWIDSGIDSALHGIDSGLHSAGNYMVNNVPTHFSGVSDGYNIGFIAAFASVALSDGATAEGLFSEIGAAEDSLVTVTHFTDPATAQIIEQSGAINAKSFVTLPSQIPAGATPAQIESILEIRAGAGQMLHTFQVPSSSLLLPENGATTSGGALQFRLGNPVPVTPGAFVPTLGGH